MYVFFRFSMSPDMARLMVSHGHCSHFVDGFVD